MYDFKEYTKKELPPASEAIERGLALASSIETEWTKSKELHGVQTYTTWIDNHYWAARVSYHDDLNYDELLATLLHNHTENEAEYIGMVESYSVLDGTNDWLSRRVHYKFPFPLKNRDMIIWLTSKETKTGSQFLTVTIPRKFESEFTKGFYISVEMVTKLPDGRIQWIMGTTSDAGGWIPQFVQRPKMLSAVAEDIPQFKDWIAKWRLSH